jgi:hypothetical protein
MWVAYTQGVTMNSERQGLRPRCSVEQHACLVCWNVALPRAFSADMQIHSSAFVATDFCSPDPVACDSVLSCLLSPFIPRICGNLIFTWHNSLWICYRLSVSNGFMSWFLRGKIGSNVKDVYYVVWTSPDLYILAFHSLLSTDTSVKL